MKTKIVFVFTLFLISFAYAGSGCCSTHGGVDCSAGPQENGKVICADKWASSSCYYGLVEICNNYNLIKNKPDEKIKENESLVGRIEDKTEDRPENKTKDLLKEIKFKKDEKIKFEVKDIQKEKEKIIVLNTIGNIKKQESYSDEKYSEKILSDVFKKINIFKKTLKK